ncbi:hypothetical protein J1TS5_10230 [Paenibacillus macerans]|nr:hypothetical protein [Paenibacillus macerans]GIP08853.1 hypothetical protein J1TS5_10230 [Paenibacillus macerans]
MNPSDERRTETLQERLRKANQEIDKHLPDLWKRAEHNLKEMEKEYYKK